MGTQAPPALASTKPSAILSAVMVKDVMRSPTAAATALAIAAGGSMLGGSPADSRSATARLAGSCARPTA